MIVLLAAIARASMSRRPPDVIRTGGPSAPADPKLAVVGSSADRVGTSFSVVDASDAVLLTGVLQKAAGTPVPWSFAEVVDVSSLQNLGEFRVITGGLTSVPWTVRVDGPREAIITVVQCCRSK